ncbi:TPA: hypothetical protein ENS27_19930 [bacterium]|nr:hypothetical protein [bacterium]
MKEEDIKNVFIYSKHPSKIRVGKTTYKMIKNKQSFGTIKIEYQTTYTKLDLIITDFERTLIDCARTKSLKLEELIAILKNPKINIDMSRIINYLEKYKKPILYNKIGLILDTTKSFTRLQEEDFEKIRKKLSKKIFYAREKELRLIRPRYKYYGKWNIMIPENLYYQIAPKTNI